ncbi:MAG: chloride channel protein [Opitutaceae bacterium]|jgi:CIC family chloride channel protein|nr:chloride channel protein [Opitutaceae bacterium]
MLVMAGMAAGLGAVIRTPVTCFLLIFEVTHQFAVLPFILVATVVSQLVARRFLREGMYEAMLRQEGEAPERLLPPRDFRRWEGMACGALACFEPVTARGLGAEALRKLLGRARFGWFPVADADGRVAGVLARAEAEAALREGRAPVLERAVWIGAERSLAEAQGLFVSEGVEFLCVGNASERRLVGVLTLHDLLRGQLGLLEE